MNQMQPYGEVHSSHMSTSAHAPTTGAPSSMSHYQQQQQHQYQQPPILQPGPNYNPPSNYPHSYGNGAPGYPVTSMVPSVQLPAMTPAGPGSSLPASQYNTAHQFDTTGQIAPPGMKPRVTATLWEDEGSLCFQVEAKGVCVARREDNHFINGTKLLNVAGMTRGRRDGILKSEKTRHVVKIGPMHLKGVWIPYERALDFANKEKITEALYPLFVQDIGALLYHPSNQRPGAGGATMAAIDQRRRPEQSQRYIPGPQTSQPPSLHHHHSMNSSIGSHVGQSTHSVPPHSSSIRPGLDRAHTFPTPPTSASSIIGGGMGNQGSSYEWNNSNVPSIQTNQPGLSIDTGISTRSVPNTPASTPPGTLQGMQQYATSQGYDNSRQLYSAPAPQQSQYSSQGPPVDRYGQPIQAGVYAKTEMAPPTRSGAEQDHPDTKPPENMLSHGHGVSQGTVEEEPEHEAEYTHASGPYTANRPNYAYSAPAVHGHVSPEMTGSPSHQNGSGRATPRTTTTGAPTWNQGYGPPQGRPQPPSTNLMNVMANDNRGAPNGSAVDNYAASGLSYPSATYGAPNGAAGVKRGRDEDDEQDYSRHRETDDIDGLKRRKTMREDSVGSGAVGSPYSNATNLQRSQSTIQQRSRR